MSNTTSLMHREYSNSNFWSKCTQFAKQAGKKILEPALKLYYSAQDPDTPLWAKSTIYGALGYFISPLDAIPDFTPVIGYSDDLGVLTLAVATVAAYIKKEHGRMARKQLKTWFN